MFLPHPTAKDEPLCARGKGKRGANTIKKDLDIVFALFLGPFQKHSGMHFGELIASCVAATSPDASNKRNGIVCSKRGDHHSRASREFFFFYFFKVHS